MLEASAPSTLVFCFDLGLLGSWAIGLEERWRATAAKLVLAMQTQMKGSKVRHAAQHGRCSWQARPGHKALGYLGTCSF